MSITVTKIPQAPAKDGEDGCVHGLLVAQRQREEEGRHPDEKKIDLQLFILLYIRDE